MKGLGKEFGGGLEEMGIEFLEKKEDRVFWREIMGLVDFIAFGLLCEVEVLSLALNF